VQVGTVIFNDPSAPIRIVRELQAELAARGYASAEEIVGMAHRRHEVRTEATR
jgi:dihydroorotate dehydrogenase (NAD+) catalytic subunit